MRGARGVLRVGNNSSKGGPFSIDMISSRLSRISFTDKCICTVGTPHHHIVARSRKVEKIHSGVLDYWSISIIQHQPQMKLFGLFVMWANVLVVWKRPMASGQLLEYGRRKYLQSWGFYFLVVQGSSFYLFCVPITIYAGFTNSWTLLYSIFIARRQATHFLKQKITYLIQMVCY